MSEHVPAERDPRRGGIRGGLRLALIILVLAVSVWLSLRGVSWTDLGRYIVRADAGWVLAAVAVTFAAHLARALRWRYLIPDGGSIPLLNAFSATIIGYMVSNIVPRSGEIIRPYVLAKRENRPVGTLLATVVVERVLDMGSLLAIFLLLLVMLPSRLGQMFPGMSEGDIAIKLLLPLVVLIAVLAVVARSDAGGRWIAALTRRLPAAWSERVAGLIDGFRRGLTVQGGAGMAMTLLLTVVIWAGYWLAIYFGFLAFDLHAGATSGGAASGGSASGAPLGPIDAIPILAITAVGTAIAPTPGGFGVYHTFARIALVSLFQVPVETAVAFGFVLHGAPYLAVTAAGLLFALREGVSLADAVRARRDA